MHDLTLPRAKRHTAAPTRHRPMESIIRTDRASVDVGAGQWIAVHHTPVVDGGFWRPKAPPVDENVVGGLLGCGLGRDVADVTGFEDRAKKA